MEKTTELEWAIRGLLVAEVTRDETKYQEKLTLSAVAAGLDIEPDYLAEIDASKNKYSLALVKLVETITENVPFTQVHAMLITMVKGDDHALANLARCVITHIGFIETAFEINLK
jgi:hypothetical protein